MLSAFLIANTAEIVARAAARGALRAGPSAVFDRGDSGIPVFLSQLIRVLGGERVKDSTPSSARVAMAASATTNGQDRLRCGFSANDLVHAYGDVCQVVTELAGEQGVGISTADFKTFNGCLDDATAHAVTEYVSQRERSAARAGTERLGVLAHELRNHLSAAVLSFDLLRSGHVGVTGQTSDIHARSLTALRNLVDRSLAEVRLDAGLSAVEDLFVDDLVQEIEVTSALQASARGVRLVVASRNLGLHVRGDRQTLAAALANLVQNAVKFTAPNTQVTIRTSTSSDRVLIDVSDHCGGISPAKLESLFAPFAQESADRSGLGLGLSIARRGAAANGGEVRVRTLPGDGCVFTLDLPRVP
jgi:signal transduction histidine kinase